MAASTTTATTATATPTVSRELSRAFDYDRAFTPVVADRRAPRR